MLYCHYAERSDQLVAGLADVLRDPLDDPFTPEIVAVHSRGIERWLAQELSARLGAGDAGDAGDGIAAHIEFPFPGRLISSVLAEVAKVDPDEDVWRPSRLVWPLLAILDDADSLRSAPELGPLHGHIQGGEQGSDGEWAPRRFAVVRHIADLFDRYAVHRPTMVRSWAQGADVDGTGAPLDEVFRWQPYLWRRVREFVATESPAERLASLDRLRADPSLSALPKRLTLFGSTSLPPSHVEVLEALAAGQPGGVGRDVHLFVLHPSSTLWRQVARLPLASERPLRERDPSLMKVAHPLLASWGRDARELQLVIAASRPKIIHHPVEAAPSTVLGAMQNDIRDNRRPAGAPTMGAIDARTVVAADDRSVQVHSCHGRTRQVEVMRDAILHALSDHPDLEPRDVLIMCPDIETFAPIIHAVFEAGNRGPAQSGHPLTGPGGTGGTGPGGTVPALIDPNPTAALRVRLADRALRQTNPLLRVVAELLDLVQDRCSSLQVLDFAAREPVRRRFQFSDHDRERLAEWVEDVNIRWGFDAEHRARYGLAGIEQNSWRHGLDRMALGVAMRDEDNAMFGGVVPYDDIEGDAVELFGRFAEMIARLRDAHAALRSPRPVAQWRDALLAAVSALTLTGERDHWQRVELGRVLNDMVEDSRYVGPDGGPGEGAHRWSCDVPISLDELRSLLDDRLRGRPRKANHRTGDLTICTLVPMRSVPHQIVGLLGMDDGAFPRRTRADADDVLELAPTVGDRDLRTEDRQLLLDAVLSAGRGLIVTYTGKDERTNEERPPAVPISELLDVIDRSVRREDDAPVRGQVLRSHPLQPFDPRNFIAARSARAIPPGVDLTEAAKSTTDGTQQDPWSFDATALAGARALSSQTQGRRSFLDAPLPPFERRDITVDTLGRFVTNPVQAFVRERLGVQLRDVDDATADEMPVALDGLQKWQIAEGMLATRRSGGDLARWEAAVRASGFLPPGGLGDLVMAPVRETVDDLLVLAESLTDPYAPTDRIAVDVLVAGHRVTGPLTNVVGNDLVTVTYGKLKPKRRLRAWVDLLLASLSLPERPLRAVTVGRTTSGVGAYLIEPLGEDAAMRAERTRAELEVLLDLFDRGMQEPLPLYCATSHAWAQRLHDDGDRAQAEAAAVKTWETDRFSAEMREPDHELVYAGERPFAAVLGEVARDDECDSAWTGWSDDERSRFARYAARLWKPLLEHEERVA